MIWLRIIRKLLCFQLLNRYRFSGINRENTKTIYLSFDDGPHEIHTNIILNILKAYEVKATFFVVGDTLLHHKILGKRIVDEGHILGNHTYSHKVLPFVSKKAVFDEVLQCQKIIEEFQATSIRLFRPPCGLMGVCELFYLKQMGFINCLWSIDSNDSLHLEANIIINRLKNMKATNSVVLFHDDSSLCLDVLNCLLPYWKTNGYEFKLLSQM